VNADGPSEPVIERYVRSGLPTAGWTEFEPRGNATVELLSAVITNEGGVPLDMPRRDEALSICVRFLTRERLPDLDVAIYLVNRQGVRVLDEAWSDTGARPRAGGAPGEYETALTIPPMLASGEYVVGIWIGSTIGSSDETFVDRELLRLRLWPNPADRQEWTERRRVVHPVVRWSTSSSAESQPREVLGEREARRPLHRS
jgi:hypothetical protein